MLQKLATFCCKNCNFCGIVGFYGKNDTFLLLNCNIWVKIAPFSPRLSMSADQSTVLSVLDVLDVLSILSVLEVLSV